MAVNYKKIFSDLGVLILIAMIAGCAAGYFMKDGAEIFTPLGTLFIQLIKMLVIPLVSVSIVSGSMSLGATRKAGKMAGYALLFIFVTSFLAGIVSAVAMVLMPLGENVPASFLQAIGGAAPVTPEIGGGFWDAIIALVPSNPVAALVEGNILQIIFFSMLLGFGLGTISEERKDVAGKFIDGLLDALIWCIKVVMWSAPIGVFALMASAVGTMGFDIFGHLAKLLALDIGLVLIMWFGFYPACIRFMSDVPVGLYLKKMLKPQSVAFSTASSMATLAVNMQTCEKELGVSKQTTAFVVPLGATINMTGNVIYYVLAALFFAQVYGMDLSMGSYLAIIAAAVLSAIGQAGVPGPTLTLFAVFIAGGIPLDGIPLLFAVDRLFDMVRTVLNITGDTCCAAVVDKYAK